MHPMQFLTEAQIAEIAAEQFASEIRGQAESLRVAARALGFRLNIITAADAFECVTVQPIRELAVH